MKPFNRLRRVAVALMLGAWFLVACQPGEVERGATASESADAVLPGAVALAGWEMVSQPENFGPENLWDYINGQAEFYLNYGFLRVDTAEYRAESGTPSVVVEVYQMASSEEAFGIYAAERNPDDRFVAGDWNSDGRDTPAVFRPGNVTHYFRFTNTQGPADAQYIWGESTWLPVAGNFTHD